MTEIQRIKKKLKVINNGVDLFAENLAATGHEVLNLDWKPPAMGEEKLISKLNNIMNYSDRIEKADDEVVKHMMEAQPVLVDIDSALNVIPGMHEKLFLHAGPPIEWERMCGPLKGAVIGGLIYEGTAANKDAAEKIASSGQIEFAPCHHHQTVGPMAGVVTPSMPVFIVEDKLSGVRSYCTLNEGLGKVLRYGAYSDEVIDRLKWMESVLSPILRKAIRQKNEINLKTIISQALLMGDECHNRNRAATSLFLRETAPAIVKTDASSNDQASVLEFINSNDHFFLNLSMPAAKCILAGIPKTDYCSIITVMSRNGTDFGIRLNSLGDEWFTAPAGIVQGLYFPGFTEKDANPDIGDSVITETAGIGGFAMAAAPAIVRFVGGSAETALQTTMEMYEITHAEHKYFSIPFLNFKGSPVGIDLLKIIETGILPAINTGIAHREPGIGQVGAGLVKPPWDCYKKAFIRFCDTYAPGEA